MPFESTAVDFQVRNNMQNSDRGTQIPEFNMPKALDIFFNPMLKLKPSS